MHCPLPDGRVYQAAGNALLSSTGTAGNSSSESKETTDDLESSWEFSGRIEAISNLTHASPLATLEKGKKTERKGHDNTDSNHHPGPWPRTL